MTTHQRLWTILATVGALAISACGSSNRGGGGGGSGVGRDGGQGGDGAATTADGGDALDGSDPGDDGTGAGGSYCAETCDSDDDCTIGGMNPTGLTCSSAGRCVNACADDAECKALYSGWTMDCTTSADCFGGSGKCLDLGDARKCAFPLAPPCAAGLTEVTVPDVDGADVVTCVSAAAAGATCESAACTTSTTTTFDCNDAATPCPANFTCDTVSGQCRCTSDAACGGYGVCNTERGACECTDATQCTATKAFDGTQLSCVSP